MNPIGSGVELDLVPVPCAMCGSAETKPRPVFEGYDYEYRTCDNRFRFVVCSDCGHVYLSPRVRMEDIDRIYPADYLPREMGCVYPDSITLRWVKQNIFERGWMRKVLADRNAGSRVLEIGAGSGSQLKYLYSISPVDIKLTANELGFPAQTRASLSALNIEMLEGPIEEVNTTAEYDVIISKHVIEHVIDPVRMFRWISGHLAPGGILYLETPDFGALTRRLFGTHWYATSYPRHFHLFSRGKIAELARYSGLEIVSQHAVVDANVWINSVRNRLAEATIGRHKLSVLVDPEKRAATRFFSLVDLFFVAIGFAGSVQAILARKPTDMS